MHRPLAKETRILPPALLMTRMIGAFVLIIRFILQSASFIMLLWLVASDAKFRPPLVCVRVVRVRESRVDVNLHRPPARLTVRLETVRSLRSPLQWVTADDVR